MAPDISSLSSLVLDFVFFSFGGVTIILIKHVKITLSRVVVFSLF